VSDRDVEHAPFAEPLDVGGGRHDAVEPREVLARERGRRQDVDRREPRSVEGRSPGSLFHPPPGSGLVPLTLSLIGWFDYLGVFFVIPYEFGRGVARWAGRSDVDRTTSR
jgi:hypothetical protein